MKVYIFIFETVAKYLWIWLNSSQACSFTHVEVSSKYKKKRMSRASSDTCGQIPNPPEEVVGGGCVVWSIYASLSFFLKKQRREKIIILDFSSTSAYFAKFTFEVCYQTLKPFVTG
jgi:hypothetical protein